ncbi:centromere protein S-like [Homarus americanus]|uniref:centromere protein S-like n=1 Tax=Homarus americanus TaxID=6706 RepID=UPI001C4673B5|nr:centromere protein S-like [Homarus americanus]
MEADEEEKLNHLQTLKAAIHFTVGRICEEVGAELGLTYHRKVIATLSEITCSQLEHYATDVEAFSNHARRTTVSTDDVKLLVRRNPQLAEHIKEMTDSMEETRKKKGKRGRKPKIKDPPEDNTEQTVIDD